jgi:hypothetical protein
MDRQVWLPRLDAARKVFYMAVRTTPTTGSDLFGTTSSVITTTDILKVKVKLTQEQATKVKSGSRFLAQLFLQPRR